MQLSLLHVKPQDSHSKPRFFSLRLALAGAEMPSFAKADMGPGTCGMIFPSPHDTSNSWETSRAFTEDASSFTVGIWPPRAYPCSFCRREFRSAQALGGHMNVHRRDRARLRHPSPPPSPFGAPLRNQQQMASSSLFQSQKYMGVSPSAAPSLADQELPALYKASSSTLNDSSYIPINFATSIPLCLHQLASEAASSLMQSPLQPCTGSADLHLSLWRPTYMMNSTKLASHKCNTRTPRLKETPTAFSSLASNAMVSSAKKPLAATATPSCRRNAPAIAAEDESPRKKSHTGSSLHSSQKSRSTSQTEDTQFSLVQIDIEDTCRTCSDESRGASSGDVDLELRLGQKPAPS